MAPWVPVNLKGKALASPRPRRMRRGVSSSLAAHVLLVQIWARGFSGPALGLAIRSPEPARSHLVAPVLATAPQGSPWTRLWGQPPGPSGDPDPSRISAPPRPRPSPSRCTGPHCSPALALTVSVSLSCVTTAALRDKTPLASETGTASSSPRQNVRNVNHF